MRIARLVARLVAGVAVAASVCVGVPGLPGGSPAAVRATTSADIVGPTGSGQFGDEVLVLSNGNFVVVDSLYDSPGNANVGAVYLYNGATRQLISTLTGGTADDFVGSDGVLEVGTGNFVVLSSHWANGGQANAGAVTWVSGTAGLGGTVEPTNSLVGTAAGDFVGSATEVLVLDNGNYVVTSPFWDNGVIGEAGAVTWANGSTGVSGAVSTSNSLYGTTTADMVGSEVIELENGNFVVGSESWDNGGATNAGAATWGSGTAGLVGAVSAANSLVGSTTNDLVGDSLFALANGNYVVASPTWDNGAITDAGAATWADGTAGTAGAVSAANSQVGSTMADNVGTSVTPLGNGNYVVSSGLWDNGAVQNVGAATWADGTGGSTGALDPSNSLVGSTAHDQVGSAVTALTNGNYVVSSRNWDDGANVDAGAVTLGDGAAGSTVGPVSTGNSLYGAAGDRAGATVTALTNGNYVVGTPLWDNGVETDAGAVTWGDGTTGVTGPIGAANSLVGSTADDQVGAHGVVALAGGNYVVASGNWDGTVTNAGAATWGNGGGETAGPVSAANSLVGSTANDFVAAQGVEPLASGAYVVGSPFWHNGALANAGAATWAPATGIVGQVTSTNSLVGGSADDFVSGNGVVALADGGYAVRSSEWDNGAVGNAGAVTLGSGATGVSGPVSAANSLVGSTADDRIANGGVTELSNGGIAVYAPLWDNGGVADASAVSVGGPLGLNGAVSATNSSLGIVADDITGFSARLTADKSIVIQHPGRNTVTLFQIDITPPVFTVAPPDQSAVAVAGATSAVVDYPTPDATDDLGGPVGVVCVPPSGSVFPLGDTLVTCTATNTEGLTATASFTVTVFEGADYVPLAPARLADTRPGFATVDGLFAGTGQVPLGTTVKLTVAGRGGVPADAAAVTLNVTVTEAAAPGFATVFPCGEARPNSSNVNFVANTTIPNAVIAKLGAEGAVCIFASQPLQLVVDVDGAFPQATSYKALNPARLLDTRQGFTTVDGQQQATGATSAASSTVLAVAGRAGVPTDAAAVVLNVTVTEPNIAGYATVYPCGTTPPTASNLNYVPGSTIPNLVVAKLGEDGTVCIYTQAQTHLIADVNGYFPAGTLFTAVQPARLLDTRIPAIYPTIDGKGSGAGVQITGTVTVVHVLGRGGVPANATTAVLNVTVTEPVAEGYVTVYPCGIDPPLASNLNFVSGQTIPNAVLSKIGTNGDVCIFNSQPTHLIADVNGYFP